MGVSEGTIKTRKDLKNMLDDVYRAASKNWKLIDDIEICIQHSPKERLLAEYGGFVQLSEGPKTISVLIKLKAPK